MASKATGVAGLADRYASALFNLADEQKALDAVAADLRSLRAMVAESADLRRLIRSPVLSRGDQARAVAALADSAAFQPITRNFLGLLAQNRRLFAVPEIADRFLSHLAERRGEITAKVTVAQRLSQEQIDALSAQLHKAVGRKVTMDIWIDPSLLGGMITQIGSRMIDASLKSKLHRLQLAMKGVQ